jgi:hypothetical protein
MKTKIIVTTSWRTVNPLSHKSDPGELKEKIDVYTLESGMDILKGGPGYEFKVGIIENKSIEIICNNNFSEVSETGRINLYSIQKEITLKLGESKKIAPAMTDCSTSWKFEVEEIIN